MAGWSGEVMALQDFQRREVLRIMAVAAFTLLQIVVFA
jgi:hypothetical protein